jgi:hypothetical protein
MNGLYGMREKRNSRQIFRRRRDAEKTNWRKGIKEW